MREIYLKRVISVFCLILAVAISMTGCGTSNNVVQDDTEAKQDTMSKEEILPDQDGNPYSTHKIVDGETIVEYDYNEAYEKLDLSQYTEHGEFGEDGIMWVKKSDYTGSQYGYMDYNGNFIVPLTSEIKKPDDFFKGFASVVYNIDEGMMFDDFECKFMNTKGEVLFTYTVDEDNYKYIYCEDSNIIRFKGITSNGIGGHHTGSVYFVKSNKLLKFSDYSYSANFSFSDGLLRTVGEQYGKIYCEFYDDNGELQLRIDENSNEYYTAIYHVDTFENGKSTVTFVGKDKCVYEVSIDKKGNWLDEPIANPYATKFKQDNF